jgi:pimeloyl-ACP methyl ester carboxylesterase
MAEDKKRFDHGGHELAFEERGPADARALIMLHGLAIDRRVLIDACEPVLAEAPLRRVYVDLPGHGDSVAEASRLGADDLCDALAALILHVAGEQQPALFGYSYGGYLAQGVMRELTPAGLFLCCPTVEADFGKRHVPPRRVARRDELLGYSDDPREKDAFEEIAVIQTAAALAHFQKVIHPANISANQEAMARVRARYAMARPYMQALGAFEGPVTIVCGRDDHWVGFEDALRLARAFKQAHYAVLPECGHLLPFEQPERFASLLKDFVARLQSA